MAIMPEEYNGVDLKSLSPKQKRFCEEYVIDNNGFASAERSGYNRKYSCELLKREDVQSYIAWLNEDMRNSRIASAQEVAERLTRIARGEGEEEVVTNSGLKILKGTDVKDRIKALELLGKKHAMFTDKVETKQEFNFVVDIEDEDSDDDDIEI